MEHKNLMDDYSMFDPPIEDENWHHHCDNCGRYTSNKSGGHRIEVKDEYSFTGTTIDVICARCFNQK